MMTTSFDPKHPMSLIKEIANRLAGSMPVFNFTAYKVTGTKYGPRNIEYNSIRIGGKYLEEDLPTFIKESEASGLDVIISSEVSLGDDGFHIPMVDFAIAPEAFSPFKSADLDKMQDLGEGSPISSYDLTFFNSGHSYHAYGKRLLNQEEWLSYLGSLLLINLPGEPEIIDTRWVGHSLQKRSSGLRLTKVNPKYLRVPTLVAKPIKKQEPEVTTFPWNLGKATSY